MRQRVRMAGLPARIARDPIVIHDLLHEATVRNVLVIIEAGAKTDRARCGRGYSHNTDGIF